MATTRRRRIRAHREQQLRALEVNRRRDVTAHVAPAEGFSGTLLKRMAWAATAVLVVAAVLLVLIA
jgi:hypothetical protein